MSWQPARPLFRAAIGVIALYALMLQAFLGSATVVAFAHEAPSLCAADTPDGSNEDGHERIHHGCCVRPVAADLLLPDASGSAVHPPSLVVLVALWRPRPPVLPHGSSDEAAYPRGPPTA